MNRKQNPGQVGVDSSVAAECIFCGRVEEGFAGQVIAQAWLTGHISAEHRDELPEFRGVKNADLSNGDADE